MTDCREMVTVGGHLWQPQFISLPTGPTGFGGVNFADTLHVIIVGKSGYGEGPGDTLDAHPGSLYFWKFAFHDVDNDTLDTVPEQIAAWFFTLANSQVANITVTVSGQPVQADTGKLLTADIRVRDIHGWYCTHWFYIRVPRLTDVRDLIAFPAEYLLY